MGGGAASQHQALGFFVFRQSFVLVWAVHHSARNFFAFARTASAVLAAIGQANALADASGQQGFVGVGGEAAATGLHGNLKAHLLGILEGLQSTRNP